MGFSPGADGMHNVIFSQTSIFSFCHLAVDCFTKRKLKMPVILTKKGIVEGIAPGKKYECPYCQVFIPNKPYDIKQHLISSSHLAKERRAKREEEATKTEAAGKRKEAERIVAMTAKAAGITGPNWAAPVQAAPEHVERRAALPVAPTRGSREDAMLAMAGPLPVKSEESEALKGSEDKDVDQTTGPAPAQTEEALDTLGAQAAVDHARDVRMRQYADTAAPAPVPRKTGGRRRKRLGKSSYSTH